MVTPPTGEESVGVDGGELVGVGDGVGDGVGVGVAAETVNCALLLHALVPYALVALTNQAQLAFASAIEGVKVQLPAPVEQLACAGVTAMFTPTPLRFWTRSW